MKKMGLVFIFMLVVFSFFQVSIIGKRKPQANPSILTAEYDDDINKDNVSVCKYVGKTK